MLIALILLCNIGYSQPGDFLQRISSLQTHHDPAGLFPGQITWHNGRRSVEDNTIFFTAITVYTLRSLRSHCSQDEQQIIDSICLRFNTALPPYRNRHGDLTYNFYPVHPEQAFANVKFLRHTRLPDDLDVTAMVYLTQPTSDSLNNALKQKMNSEVQESKKVKSTSKAYRQSLAYRTWFADKMNQDIDLCVNANVLTFVFQKKIPFDSIDEASVRVIKEMIQNDEHLHKGNLISPHYQNPSVILYHIARLMAVTNHPELTPLRSKIVSDLQSRLTHVSNEMERVILLSSLYRLGENTLFTIDLTKLKTDMNQFYWFKANLLYGRPLWIKKIFNGSNFLHYQYKSEAYYWTLLLELQKFSNAHVETNERQQKILIGRQQ